MMQAEESREGDSGREGSSSDSLNSLLAQVFLLNADLLSLRISYDDEGKDNTLLYYLLTRQ